MPNGARFVFVQPSLPTMDIISAHAFSSNHRSQVETSKLCGCFYCVAMFPPTEIVEWVDLDSTAMCPRCGIDSIIGSASEVPIAAEFLERMRAHWFDT
jgi:hypothetical protein